MPYDEFRMKRIVSLAAIAVAVLIHARGPACGIELDVEELVLENGMRFLIVERHKSPVVSFNIVYLVGSVDERPGITGVSHFLEHMMFKGTKTVGTRNYRKEKKIIDEIRRLMKMMDKAEDTKTRERLADKIERARGKQRDLIVKDEIWKIYRKNGAVGFNASTGRDYTSYTCSLPSNRIELWAMIESDRMANPVFREFYAERDVVCEERRMRVDTDPGGALMERLYATAYMAHPYRWPVLGWDSDITSYTPGEVERYFRKYYCPANTIAVVVGDVDRARVKALAEKYFGRIPGGSPGERVVTREPPQKGEKRVRVDFEAEPRLAIAYHAPSVSDENHYVMDVISTILADGRTSRLYRRLVLEEESALSVSAWFATRKYPGLFVFTAAPRNPHTIEDVMGSIDEEIERLKNKKVGKRELAKAVNKIEADFIRGLESNSKLAGHIAYFAAITDWRYINTYVEKIRGVTPSDIRETVRRYFTVGSRTIVTLEKRHEE